MKLSDLLEVVGGTLVGDAEFSSIEHDSRRVGKGCLFVCLVGEREDGHSYAEEACRLGAVALLVERKLDLPVAQLVVEDCRLALGEVAQAFYGYPGRSLTMLGVTGTNGKTSVAYLLRNVLEEAGYKAVYVGTLGVVGCGMDRKTSLTTPDPLELAALMQEMVAVGVQYVTMELSAHAIYWKKLSGLHFKGIILTNLSQDHLDFFGDMQRYRAVKMSVFDLAHTHLGIVNSDDEMGRLLLRSAGLPLLSYGLDNPADVFAVRIRENREGVEFVLNAFDVIYRLRTPLHGNFNVYNALAVATLSGYLGIDAGAVQRAFAVARVPGRFDCIEKNGVQFVVDYAHTPDGLQKSMRACRKLGGRLLVVFGCGGDRDRDKRAKMGRIASRLGDYVIITSDNPRSEDPLQIAKSVEAGVAYSDSHEVILDRTLAIRRAAKLAKPGDVVLVAGKGAEETVEVNGELLPYSDYAVIEEL